MDQGWQVQVGRAKLFLLDINDPANLPSFPITLTVGGGPELRLKQELVLGIGGWRLLRALGLWREVCHLNEGHAAFAVLLVIAGEAHPQDAEGQEMTTQWFEFARRFRVRLRVVFLSDYDVLMAEHLVQGVDVLVNTPRRPWEASGTSGMKVLVNGGLNLSELDGWWAEAYSPEVGWAIGDGREHGDYPSWDAAEAESLYAVLEKEVIPEFYARDEHGIPRGWVARMRESMARLIPPFRPIAPSANIPKDTIFRRQKLSPARNYTTVL